MSPPADGIRQWCRSPWSATLDMHTEIRSPRHQTQGGSPVNTTTGKHLPAQMRASDADRDAVVSDLSAHFQAGRLTAGELDQRTGQALAARTWGELTGLLADLPPARSAPQAP